MSRPNFPPEADQLGEWALQRFQALGGQTPLPLTITVTVKEPDGTEHTVSLKWWPREQEERPERSKRSA